MHIDPFAAVSHLFVSMTICVRPRSTTGSSFFDIVLTLALLMW
jgi:hypothetical protein